MKNITDLAYHIKRYFQIYLPGIKGLSNSTILSYRDNITIFLRYCEAKEGLKIEKISLKHINKDMVERFLDDLETNMQYSIASRNQRLAAIRAFFRYIMHEDISYISLAQEILNIPLKKAPKSIPEHLTLQGIEILLSQPDINDSHKIRDLTLMAFMYDTGARVQECIDLTVGDIRIESPSTAILHGKGNKVRVLPLMRNTLSLLKKYLEINNLLAPEKKCSPVFVNKYGNRLTRAGISYILNKYSKQANQQCPDIVPEHIHPHMLRHSRAMHLLQAGVNLVYIRDFLGHSSVTTTEIYARADSEIKRKAIEKASPDITHNMVGEWENNKDLLKWLKSL